MFSTRNTFILAVLAAVSLGVGSARGADGAPAGGGAPKPQDPNIGQDVTSPPPGSPEDQELWKSGHLVTQAVQVERARATRLQTVLLNLRYNERVQALRARGGEAEAQGAKLQGRLSDAHATQFAVLTARWPVDTYRVCGYPTMEFGSMLMYGKAEPADLARHRAMLTGCVEQARASVKAMKDGNDGLEAAMKAADDVLGPAGLGPGSAVVVASPSAGGTATEKPAASEKPAANEKPAAAEHHDNHEKHDHPGGRTDDHREEH